MNGYTAFREGAALVERVPVGAVVVWGPDAFRFLQDIVSQDLSGLAVGQGAHSLLLQPTGKLDVDFRILRAAGPSGPRPPAPGAGDTEFWLDTEPGWGGRLASSLRRFLLRVQVEVEDRDDEGPSGPTERGTQWGVVALRGPEAIGVVERAVRVDGVEVPAVLHAHTAWGEVRVVRADWPGLPGIDVLGPAAAVTAIVPTLVDHGAIPATEREWETVRVECGVPRLGAELDDGVIPQEAFLDEVAVSFDKGCFLGQELVCRIHDRGHVNRHLRRLRLVEGGLPPVGAEILAGYLPDEKTVGAVTSAVDSPALGVPVALGYLHRAIEPGAEVALRWDGGEARAVVEAVHTGG